MPSRSLHRKFPCPVIRFAARTAKLRHNPACTRFAPRREINLTGIATSSPTVPTDLCNPGQSEPDQVWTPDPTGAYPQVTQTSGTPATPSVTFATAALRSRAIGGTRTPTPDGTAT